MAKHPIFDPKAAEHRESMFADIGAFIFQFSQLEHIIRMELTGALRLKKEQITAVTGPYDFAALCRVTKTILKQKSPEKAGHIEQALNKCLKLNEERVRVAHSLWTMDKSGSRAWHISRNSLKADRYFGDPGALARLTEDARRCKVEVATISRDKPKGSPTMKLLDIEIGEPRPKRRKAPGKPKK
jgi:hypothetical protein